jgi:hypothetical protein
VPIRKIRLIRVRILKVKNGSADETDDADQRGWGRDCYFDPCQSVYPLQEARKCLEVKKYVRKMREILPFTQNMYIQPLLLTCAAAQSVAS